MKGTQLIYHILIDRFSGDDEKRGRGFKGGTLRGIISRLDYIQGLGAAGIMLSPFYATAAYHGYHITDYEKVEDRFGTLHDLCKLVDEVHKRGMIIVADFVPNHCHKNNPLYKRNTYREWFLHGKDGRERFFNGLDNLPVLNLDNPQARDYMTARGRNLCQLGFDAIRIDHATGPSYGFLKHFVRSLKKEFPDVRIIGEILGPLDFKPRSKQYKDNAKRFSEQEARQMEYIGVLDGVIDFRYYELMKYAAVNDRRFYGNLKLETALRQHFDNYPKDFDLWLLLDNHDLNRFLFECGGDRSLLDEAIRYSKQWGRPLMYYYGTEVGMTNTITITDGTPYADERVRQCMKWK